MAMKYIKTADFLLVSGAGYFTNLDESNRHYGLNMYGPNTLHALETIGRHYFGQMYINLSLIF